MRTSRRCVRRERQPAGAGSGSAASSTTLTNGPTTTNAYPPAPIGDPLTASDATGAVPPSTFAAQPPAMAPATTGVAVASPSPDSPDANVASNPGVNDQTKNADNTKANERDRHGTLTPMNQGNSGSETKITASIRKGLMGDKSLSFTAKNVKIITVGSKVTLRGPVNSDQEKAAIEAHAKQTPGVTDVDDQIEVKK